MIRIVAVSREQHGLTIVIRWVPAMDAVSPRVVRLILGAVEAAVQIINGAYRQGQVTAQ